MGKTIIGAAFALPLVVGGSLYSASISNIHHSDYELTSEALVMIPVPNQQYADAAANLYLDPLGFNGTPMTVDIPEAIPGSAGLGHTVGIDVQYLVTAVEQQVDSGAVDAANPLYIFGYSQSAVAASMAEQQLHDDGIPSDYLHFVLVGDSASADGGFLNTFIDSLPASMQSSVTQMLLQFGLGDVLGATTPDDLYPTTVYTLSADGWANWDNGANLPGLFIDHLAYMGLTPEEVGSATLSLADGMTDYYTIDSAHVDLFSALLNGLAIALFLQ